MRVGVLGGSFDPIHHGHLIAAASLAESLALDEVRLMVSRRQPLKDGGHGAPPEDRAVMAELAVQGEPRLRADRAELAREGLSYTVDTLRGLRDELPEAELVLLLGADAAAGFPRWREPEAIRALARLQVFAREGVGASGEGVGGVAVPRVDISSTAIRARVREGRSIRYWVPDAVADYIAIHRLYRED